MTESVAAPMVARYEELKRLKFKIDSELIALENGLRVAGWLPRVGRPRIVPTHTDDEAREAHAKFQRGDRAKWTVDGERQYQRSRKRIKREAGAA